MWFEEKTKCRGNQISYVLLLKRVPSNIVSALSSTMDRSPDTDRSPSIIGNSPVGIALVLLVALGKRDKNQRADAPSVCRGGSCQCGRSYQPPELFGTSDDKGTRSRSLFFGSAASRRLCSHFYNNNARIILLPSTIATMHMENTYKSRLHMQLK